jgi:hypothetical protein
MKMYTLKEVAEKLQINRRHALRLFGHVEGVLVLNPDAQRRTIRIPESIYLKEVERMGKRIDAVEAANQRLREQRRNKR